MFDYIKGNVEEIGDGYVVLDNNGIGYLIHTSRNSILNINSQTREVKMHTYLVVREDGLSLYGFVNKEELDMFKLLLLVSGVGPKVALGILSTLNPSSLKFAIINNDVDTLSKAPGIGKKTGKRIILELKDKIDNNINVDNDYAVNDEDNRISEAVSALLALGYSRNEINKALSAIDKDNSNTEELIRLTLKQLARQ